MDPMDQKSYVLNWKSQKVLTASKGLVYAIGVDGFLRRRLAVGLRRHVEARHGGRGQRGQRAVQRLRTSRAYGETGEVICKAKSILR